MNFVDIYIYIYIYIIYYLLDIGLFINTLFLRIISLNHLQTPPISNKYKLQQLKTLVLIININ